MELQWPISRLQCSIIFASYYTKLLTFIYLYFQADQPLVVAAVRVLCVWLAEETTALKAQVFQLLPFLVKVV